MKHFIIFCFSLFSAENSYSMSLDSMFLLIYPQHEIMCNADLFMSCYSSLGQGFIHFLIQIRHAQLFALDEWASAETDHDSSLTSAIQDLKASTVRVPIIGGARVCC